MKATDYVLTEEDRVKDLDTLEDGEQVIILRPNGETVAREWYGYGSRSGWKVYRDPRPMPRIISAKEKTYEGSLSGFVIALVKAFHKMAAMLKGAAP